MFLWHFIFDKSFVSLEGFCMLSCDFFPNSVVAFIVGAPCTMWPWHRLQCRSTWVVAVYFFCSRSKSHSWQRIAPTGSASAAAHDRRTRSPKELEQAITTVDDDKSRMRKVDISLAWKHSRNDGVKDLMADLALYWGLRKMRLGRWRLGDQIELPKWWRVEAS